jgi:hypothetical protein
MALLLAAVMQTAGAQAPVARDPLRRLASRLGFTYRTDPAEIEDKLRGVIERRVRREAGREILALDVADKAIERTPATNKGPFGDVDTSVRRLARGEQLPRPEDLRGGKARA